MPTDFENSVYQITKKIPKGKVATYKQIAIALGDVHAVRAVGNALHKNPFAPDVPCHRVVNAQGLFASNFGAKGGLIEQKRRLEKEGVVSSEGKSVSLEKYQYYFKKE